MADVVKARARDRRVRRDAPAQPLGCHRFPTVDGTPVVPDQVEALAGQQRIGHGGEVVGKLLAVHILEVPIAFRVILQEWYDQM